MDTENGNFVHFLLLTNLQTNHGRNTILEGKDALYACKNINNTIKCLRRLRWNKIKRKRNLYV